MVNTPARVRAVANMLTVQPRLLQTALGAVLTLDESSYIRIIKGLCNTGQCEHVLKVHSHPSPAAALHATRSVCRCSMRPLRASPCSARPYAAASTRKRSTWYMTRPCGLRLCGDALRRLSRAYCLRASKGSENVVAGGASTCQAIGARPCQAYNRHVRPMSALKNTVTSPQDCAGTAPRLL